MFYCERCGEADCCERMDLPTEPVLCDACYEKATREKLIDVFMHIGDHITNRDEYGICFDTPLAKAIEDVLAMLKSQDAHGATVQEWIPVSEPPKERGCYLISVKHWIDGKPVTREAFWNGADWLSCYWKKGDRVELTPRVTHWMPLPWPVKEGDENN